MSFLSNKVMWYKHSVHENLIRCCLIIVYEEPNIKLLVIQQRGSTVSGKRQEFVNELLTFFKNEQLKEIVVLTVFNAVERNDSQLSG